MNQQLIIVFIGFLLVAVLLLLMVSQGREKGLRTIVIVDLSACPDAGQLRESLGPCLRRISEDAPLRFVFDDDPRMKADHFPKVVLIPDAGQRIEFRIFPPPPAAAIGIMGPVNVEDMDPDLVRRLRDALLFSSRG